MGLDAARAGWAQNSLCRPRRPQSLLQRKRMPKFVKILLACLICLAVAGGVVWLVGALSA